MADITDDIDAALEAGFEQRMDEQEKYSKNDPNLSHNLPTYNERGNPPQPFDNVRHAEEEKESSDGSYYDAAEK